MTTPRQTISVLGLGRMGSAIAARLTEQVGDQHEIRTWTRSAGGAPAEVVAGADVVLLCLYDGPPAARCSRPARAPCPQA